MNIERIVEILVKEGYTVPKNYLKYIQEYVVPWQEWYKGHVANFHSYKETAGQQKAVNKTRSKLFMAKTVAEDWASFLLNEKTFINLDDETSSKFLVGDESEQENGLLGVNKFWINANKLVERAYALGTCAVVITIDNAILKGDLIVKGDIKLKYIKNPQRIIPLKWENSEIIDVAIVTTYTKEGKDYFNLQIHQKTEKGYKITNEEYRYSDYRYTKVKFDGVESFEVKNKMFAILSPNLENNYTDDVPMGISIYATAIDAFKSADSAYTNFDKDFLLGGKKVFISQDGVAGIMGADGQFIPSADDTIDNNLYVILPKSLEDKTKLFEEYNPAIRVEENTKGIQTALNLISVKCKLGMNFYNFDSESKSVYQNTSSTKASNEALIKSVGKQRIAVTEFLKQVVESVLYLAKELGENVKVDSKLNIEFDDTYFSDAVSERARDAQEVRDGLMTKWEFRVKWYGETEEEAKKVLAEAEAPEEENAKVFGE